MSMPDEKARALNQTREWLVLLLDREYKPKMSEIRAKACALLRHYPWTMDAEVMEKALVAQHNRTMKRMMLGANRLIRAVNRAHDATGKSTLRFP